MSTLTRAPPRSSSLPDHPRHTQFSPSHTSLNLSLSLAQSPRSLNMHAKSFSSSSTDSFSFASTLSSPPLSPESNSRDHAKLDNKTPRVPLPLRRTLLRKLSTKLRRHTLPSTPPPPMPLPIPGLTFTPPPTPSTRAVPKAAHKSTLSWPAPDTARHTSFALVRSPRLALPLEQATPSLGSDEDSSDDGTASFPRTPLPARFTFPSPPHRLAPLLGIAPRAKLMTSSAVGKSAPPSLTIRVNEVDLAIFLGLDPARVLQPHYLPWDPSSPSNPNAEERFVAIAADPLQVAHLEEGASDLRRVRSREFACDGMVCLAGGSDEEEDSLWEERERFLSRVERLLWA